MKIMGLLLGHHGFNVAAMMEIQTTPSTRPTMDCRRLMIMYIMGKEIIAGMQYDVMLTNGHFHLLPLLLSTNVFRHLGILCLGRRLKIIWHSQTRMKTNFTARDMEHNI